MWDFHLLKALRKTSKRNPKVVSFPEENPKRDNLCLTKENEPKPHICVHCNKEGHMSGACKTISKISGRGVILSQMK